MGVLLYVSFMWKLCENCTTDVVKWSYFLMHTSYLYPNFSKCLTLVVQSPAKCCGLSKLGGFATIKQYHENPGKIGGLMISWLSSSSFRNSGGIFMASRFFLLLTQSTREENQTFKKIEHLSCIMINDIKFLLQTLISLFLYNNSFLWKLLKSCNIWSSTCPNTAII